jgi:hypothetical protein
VITLLKDTSEVKIGTQWHATQPHLAVERTAATHDSPEQTNEKTKSFISFIDLAHKRHSDLDELAPKNILRFVFW